MKSSLSPSQLSHALRNDTSQHMRWRRAMLGLALPEAREAWQHIKS